MSVDLIRAIEPSAPDSAPESAATSGREQASEFPRVLESKLESAREKKSQAASREADTPRKTAREDESSEASTSASSAAESAEEGASTSETSKPSEAAVEKDEVALETPVVALATENSATVAESGSVGAQAAVAADRIREHAGLLGAEEIEGRATDLDAKGGSGGRAESEIEAGEAGREISREIGDGLLAEAKAQEEVDSRPETVESALSGGAEGKAVVSPEVAHATTAPEARNEQQNQVPVESREALPSATAEGEEGQVEARGESGSERSPDEDSPRNQDTNLYERAAEGSQSAEVDATQRQAIETQQAGQRAPDTVVLDGATAVANPVAGAVTEVTTAAPGTPTPPAASDAISVQTEWLLSRGGGSAQLVLHPPELGEIAIRVTLRGNAVDVVMVAQEAAAKGIAEEQSERLSLAFSNRDLRMENFEVRRGEAADLPAAGDEEFAESGAEREGRGQEEEGAGGRAGSTGSDPSRPLDRAAMPRILTAAPETGVDLRI